MSQPAESHRVPTGGEAPRPAKKPYEKPAVRFERVFETAALACGKLLAGSPCKQAKKTS